MAFEYRAPFATSLVMHSLALIAVVAVRGASSTQSQKPPAFAVSLQLVDVAEERPTVVQPALGPSAAVPSPPRRVVQVADTAPLPQKKVVVKPRSVDVAKDSRSLQPQTADIPVIKSSQSSIVSPAEGIQVSARPDYLQNPPPRYPESARRRRSEGVVEVKVSVTIEGEAESVELERTSGDSILDSAAMEAVKKWKFKPATLAGIPKATIIVVPVRFRLRP